MVIKLTTSTYYIHTFLLHIRVLTESLLMISVHAVNVAWVTQCSYFTACADAACDVILPEGMFLISF